MTIPLLTDKEVAKSVLLVYLLSSLIRESDFLPLVTLNVYDIITLDSNFLLFVTATVTLSTSLIDTDKASDILCFTAKIKDDFVA